MPNLDIRRRLSDPEEPLLGLVGKVLFAVIFLIVATTAVTASAPLLVVAAFVTAGIMAHAVFPTDRVGDWFGALWEGKVTADWYDRFCSLLSWLWARIRWPFEQLWKLGTAVRSALEV